MSAVAELERKVGGTEVTLSTTLRSGFVAPEGYVLASIDYSSQELYVAAVLSGDQTMLQAFKSPEKLPLLDADNNPIVKDGQAVYYKNPDADLHTITAQGCCYPELFRNQPKHEWVGIAKDASLISAKGSARDAAKRVNFGICYGQTAQAMTNLYHVPLALTEEWLKRHKETYPDFHRFAHDVGILSETRGWSLNKDGRLRWVAEDNAKAAGASPARSGVNFQIQGYSATQAKLAMKYVFEAFQGTAARLGMMIHDELVCIVPGKLTLVPDKCKIENGVLIPIYEPNAEAHQWAKLCQDLMEKAQAETFDHIWPGRAEASVAKYWSK